MKKTIITVALVLALVAAIAVPVMAAAQKVALTPIPGLSGGGFVIFNNSAGPNNLEVTVALKGAPANATYDIYLFVDGSWYNGAPVGTVTTNKQGNANFHINVAVDPGETHDLDVDVALPVTGADQFLTPWGQTSILFK